jgi:hypothetical protein
VWPVCKGATSVNLTSGGGLFGVVAVSQVIQLPTYKSIFLFRISLYNKKKLVKNCVSFPMTIFQFFFITI